MTLSEFKNSLLTSHPPKGMSSVLLALWHDAKGDWEASHNVAQDIDTKEGAWIHAYLHRKEGDIWNADYWYRNAGRKRPESTLEEEWNSLVNEFITAK